MANIIPFKGLRHNINKIDDLSIITTPPYDVISSEAQENFYDKNKYNIIRLELGKDFNDDNKSNNKYTRAASYLDKWIEDEILTQEVLPAIYIYDQEFSTPEGEVKTRRGMVALIKLAEFSEGIILPHEYTLSKAKIDRFNLMQTTNSNISQIFSLYNDNNEVIPILNKYTSIKTPEIDYTNSEGIGEKLWVLTDEEIILQIQKAFSNKQLFIADGHHRYETALNFRNKIVSQNTKHTGNELYNYVMMTLVDMNDPGLLVFPTHRVLNNLDSFDSKNFLEWASENFHIEKVLNNPVKDKTYVSNKIKTSLEKMLSINKSFVYYDGHENAYYILTLKDIYSLEKILPFKAPAYRNLDVAILHSLILEQYFNINAENMTQQTNLSYTRNIEEALEWVESGTYQCAFFLNPTLISQIKEVSLANEKMPQKSTYFYPKLTTGLVINKFK